MAQRPDDSMMHEPCALVAIILYICGQIYEIELTKVCICNHF